MRTTILRASVIVTRLRRKDGILEALELLELDARTFRSPGGHAVLEPLLVALLPGLHEHRVLGRLLAFRNLGQRELRLVVAAAALVAQPRALEDDVRQLEHV